MRDQTNPNGSKAMPVFCLYPKALSMFTLRSL